MPAKAEPHQGSHEQPMPVRLRGHHFLCMLTYKGLGYSKPFTLNMDKVIAHIASGAELSLIEGPDDICSGLTEACRLASGHDCADPETLMMDDLARVAVESILGRDVRHATAISSLELTLLRRNFASGAARRACTRCSWFDLCTTIAANDFAETRLQIKSPIADHAEP
jgi:uncharacterized protein